MSNVSPRLRILALGWLLTGVVPLEAADMPAATALVPARAAGLPSEEAAPASVPEAAVAEAEEELVEFPTEPVDLDKPGVVNMALKAAPLQTVLEQIVLNAGRDLVIRDVEKETYVTAFLSGVSVREALDSICEITGLRYKMRGRIIVFRRPGQVEVPDAEAAGQVPRAAPAADSPSN